MTRLRFGWSRHAGTAAAWIVARCAVAGALTALLTGCGPKSDQVAAGLDIPAAYRASPDDTTAVWPAEDWWKGFNSPELNALIEQARRGNFDIQAAIARVRQADAQVRIAGAALLPALNGTASAQWQHLGYGAGTTSGSVGGNGSADFRTYSVGLSAAYQFDFWGHNLSHQRSAIASAEFSRYDQCTVALTVASPGIPMSPTTGLPPALALADRLAVARGNVADAPSARDWR